MEHYAPSETAVKGEGRHSAQSVATLNQGCKENSINEVALTATSPPGPALVGRSPAALRTLNGGGVAGVRWGFPQNTAYEARRTLHRLQCYHLGLDL